MRLSDAWMIFVFLSFAMYIVLDGYDLGIGVLTLFERDDRRRREMHELVSWVWDGNESWLVLVALTLWAGVPLVTSVALPALYLVLIPMLWSLIARGVSLELIEQHKGWPRVWGALFALNGAVSLVLGLPLVPVGSVGATPVPDVNLLVQDSVGWPAYVRQVTEVFDALPDRGAAAVLASNYGEAGALHHEHEGANLAYKP